MPITWDDEAAPPKPSGGIRWDDVAISPEEEQRRAADIARVKSYFAQQHQHRVLDEMSPLDKLRVGIAEPLVKVGRGLAQIKDQAAAMLGTAYTAAGLSGGDELQAVIDERQAAMAHRVAGEASALAQIHDDSPWMVGAGNMIGELAMSRLGGPAGNTMRGAAAIGAVQEGLKYSEDGMAGRGTAAAKGGVGGAVGMGVMNAAGKGINFLRRVYKDRATQTVMDEAAKAGVPLVLADMKPGNGVLQTIDQYLAKLPAIGTGGTREVQAAKARQALEMYRDSFKRYVGDSADEVQQGLFRALTGNKAQAKKMYDEVGRLTQGQIMPLTAAASQAKSILTKMRQDFGGNESLIPAPVRSILAKFEQPLVVTFDGARKLRSQMKTEIRAAMKDTMIGDEEARTLGRVLSGLEADIRHWGAQKGGVIGQKLKAADQFYRDNVVPFKDKMLARVANSEELDLMLPDLLKSPVRARKLYAAAGPKGQDAIRYTMLDTALEQATVNKGMPTESISPKRFVNAIDKMRASFGEAFKGAERQKLDGLTNLLRHLGGVDRARAMPQSAMGVSLQSMQLGGPVAAGYAAAGPAGAAGALGALATLRAAFGSNTGTRLVMAASDMRKDPKTIQAIWNTLRQVAAKNYAVIQGQAAPDED